MNSPVGLKGHFVIPGSNVPAIVNNFSIDLLETNNISGTIRIVVYDSSNNILGVHYNGDIYGFETIVFPYDDIHSFQITYVQPNQFAIGLLEFDAPRTIPVTSKILFREKSDGKKDGTWGGAGDFIPGYDHVGFNFEALVYESHPGYFEGTYYSEDGTVFKIYT